jgi:hypothetical protein
MDISDILLSETNVCNVRVRAGGHMRDHADGLVDVERHLFGLVDDDGSDPPWPGGAMPDDAEVLARPNRVDFRSAAEDEVAAVRLESWADEPQPPGDDWSAVEETTLTLSSGRVRWWTLTSGPASEPFLVGPPGAYRLRVFVRGAEQALVLRLQGEEIPDGTEGYLCQFRPA